jgi:hypothetical protein
VNAVDAHTFNMQTIKVFKHLPDRNIISDVSWDRKGIVVVEIL